MAKILEIEELQKAQTYLKSTESIFVISYSPKGWSYSPYANGNSGLNLNKRNAERKDQALLLEDSSRNLSKRCLILASWPIKVGS
jgi:hypothetical protein